MKLVLTPMGSTVLHSPSTVQAEVLVQTDVYLVLWGSTCSQQAARAGDGLPPGPRLDAEAGERQRLGQSPPFLSLFWLCRAQGACSAVMRVEEAVSVPLAWWPWQLQPCIALRCKQNLHCPAPTGTGSGGGRQLSWLCPWKLLHVSSGAVAANSDLASVDEWFKLSFLSSTCLRPPATLPSLAKCRPSSGPTAEFLRGCSGSFAASMFKPNVLYLSWLSSDFPLG